MVDAAPRSPKPPHSLWLGIMIGVIVGSLSAIVLLG
jgi:hypothetical protein